MRRISVMLIMTLAACGGGNAVSGGSTSTSISPSTTSTLETLVTIPPLSEPSTSDGTTSTPEVSSATTSEPEDLGVPTTSDGLQPRPPTTRVPQPHLSGIPDWFDDQVDLPALLAVAIKTRLAADTGTPIDQVSEEGAMFVTWPDSGLGCSDPGEVNLQVLTDGYLAYFDVAGTRYRVHTGADTAFRICDLTAPPDLLPAR